MTKSFRIKNNYSLFEALKIKETSSGHLVVIIADPIEENPRNRRFYLDNTSDLSDKLILLVDEVRKGIKWNQLEKIIDEFDSIVIDKPYLTADLDNFKKIQELASTHEKRLVEVDANVFQPTEIVSQKEEYSAKTIRDKIWELFIPELVLLESAISKGESIAENILDDFLVNKLSSYEKRNDPAIDYLSGLSPYLKYGMISPNVIYDKVIKTNSQGSKAFLEELIVRRGLAYNFILYNPDYDKFSRMTYGWAYKTMEDHQHDIRKYLYNIDDYLNFSTHDRYFNAAMKEMVYFGKMHSYMRMYWAKKIIEWSETYEIAYNNTIYLNNYYFLDGNTPNGYAGVAWCFGKHDRAWSERLIFGKLRYMNDNGLKAKFNIEEYVNRIERQIKERDL